MHDWVRTMDSGATKFSFARAKCDFEWVFRTFTAIFSKNEVHNLNIHIFFFHMRPYALNMNDACSRKSCMKTCFISTYSTDSRKTSIQLIPEQSLTFPFIPPCLCKFIEALRLLLAAKSGKLNGSLFNYPPIWVKLKHIFKLSFLQHA